MSTILPKTNCIICEQEYQPYNKTFVNGQLLREHVTHKAFLALKPLIKEDDINTFHLSYRKLTGKIYRD